MNGLFLNEYKEIHTGFPISKLFFSSDSLDTFGKDLVPFIFLKWTFDCKALIWVIIKLKLNSLFKVKFLRLLVTHFCSKSSIIQKFLSFINLHKFDCQYKTKDRITELIIKKKHFEIEHPV